MAADTVPPSLACLLAEVVPEERVTRVLAGIFYQPPREGERLSNGILVDTDGRQVGPGCVDALVLPAGSWGGGW